MDGEEEGDEVLFGDRRGERVTEECVEDEMGCDGIREGGREQRSTEREGRVGKGGRRSARHALCSFSELSW